MAGERSGPGRQPPPPLARRDLLRLAAVAPALLVAGCDIRLQDDAPDLPLLQRKSVPDEATLVAAVRLTTALGQLAGRVPQPPAAVAALAGLHQTQASVLTGRLTAQGVPQHVINVPAATPAPTSTAPATDPPTPRPTAAVSAPPVSTAADLTAGEVAAVTAMLPLLGPVTAANRAVLVSVAAACATAAEQLGATLTWPAADPLPPAAAEPLLADTRAAVYAMQVVAAQTGGEERARALTTRNQLDARQAQLLALAGASAPLAPLGYALPFPVTDADAAARLASQVLTTLVAGGLRPLDAVAAGSTAVVPLARSLAEAAAIGRPWGVAPVPFPGLAYP
ncbi:MAG: DUF4439 domain-containing protein [Lapillicoccus sp.]